MNIISRRPFALFDHAHACGMLEEDEVFNVLCTKY